MTNNTHFQCKRCCDSIGKQLHSTAQKNYSNQTDRELQAETDLFFCTPCSILGSEQTFNLTVNKLICIIYYCKISIFRCLLTNPYCKDGI